MKQYGGKYMEEKEKHRKHRITDISENFRSLADNKRKNMFIPNESFNRSEM